MTIKLFKTLLALSFQLHIQLVTDEPNAFDGAMAHYGSFSGVRNYIALVGPKGRDLDEKLGYYGERIVLRAQMLGLNTCWVALSFSKSAAKRSIDIAPGEKMVLVISLGYGVTQGTAHKSKPVPRVFPAADTAPAWTVTVVEAALLAPTAVNQQQFRLTVTGDTLTAVNLGGFYSKVDLGIVKYHIDVAARG